MSSTPVFYNKRKNCDEKRNTGIMSEAQSTNNITNISTSNININIPQITEYATQYSSHMKTCTRKRKRSMKHYEHALNLRPAPIQASTFQFNSNFNTHDAPINNSIINTFINRNINSITNISNTNLISNQKQMPFKNINMPLMNVPQIVPQMSISKNDHPPINIEQHPEFKNICSILIATKENVALLKQKNTADTKRMRELRAEVKILKNKEYEHDRQFVKSFTNKKYHKQNAMLRGRVESLIIENEQKKEQYNIQQNRLKSLVMCSNILKEKNISNALIFENLSLSYNQLQMKKILSVANVNSNNNEQGGIGGDITMENKNTDADLFVSDIAVNKMEKITNNILIQMGDPVNGMGKLINSLTADSGERFKEYIEPYSQQKRPMPNMIKVLLNLVDLSQVYMFNFLSKSMDKETTENVQKFEMKSHVIIFSVEELELKQYQTCKLEYLALELLVKFLFESRKVNNISVLKIYRKNISVFDKTVRCELSFMKSKTLAMEIMKELICEQQKEVIMYMIKKNTNDESFIHYILLSILKCSKVKHFSENFRKTNVKALNMSILEYQQSVVSFMNALISQNCMEIIGHILQLRFDFHSDKNENDSEQKMESVAFLLAEVLQIQRQNKADVDGESDAPERSLMILTVMLLLKNLILKMSSKDRAEVAYNTELVSLLKFLQENDGYVIVGDIQKIVGW